MKRFEISMPLGCPVQTALPLAFEVFSRRVQLDGGFV